MPVELVMPRVSPAMQDATVVEWLKREGDSVRKDEIVVVIESEKASQEVEALADGILYRIVAPVGTVVPVNKPLAIIRLPQDTADDLGVWKPGSAAATAALTDSRTASAPQIAASDGAVRWSPSARKLAASLGIELVNMTSGSGPGGRIVERDVLAFQEAREARAKAPVGTPVDLSADTLADVRVPLSPMRRQTMVRLIKSRESVVPVTSVTEVDLTNLVALHRNLKASWKSKRNIDITLNAWFVRATAMALRQHEILNAILADNEVIIKRNINIGLAMQVNDGLYAPVVRNADMLSLSQAAEQISMLLKKIQDKSITTSDMSDGSFTITNVGPFDVLLSTPVVVHPQVAILGIGKIAERPVFIGEQIAKRNICCLSLTYDHRVVDGVPAALFRTTLKDLLEYPTTLLS